MTTTHERIKTVIHYDMLDTIGRQFRFKHAKGTAEWLKNSLDHYLRLHEAGAEPWSGQWPVLVNLIDGGKGLPGPNLAVIDFGGTSYHHVQNFLLHWGDRSAATHGRTSTAHVTGGHGNGGKFYMREMWRDGARFLTWRDGKMTSLVVDKRDDGTTGEWEARDEPATWREALRAALPASEGLRGGDEIIAYLEMHQPCLLTELDAGRRGLTVVAGRRAVRVSRSRGSVSGKRWNTQRYVDELRDAAQARRPIRELAISILVNGALRIPRLTLETVPEDPDWPEETVTLPGDLIPDDAPLPGFSSLGELRLKKAAIPLTGKRKDRNAVHVVDSVGNLIASYPIAELPLASRSPVLSFLHGDLHLTFTSVDNYVQNDRERLADAPVTAAILAWLAGRIDERVDALESTQRQEAHKRDLDVAASLNDVLNKHARHFLQKMQAEIFVDLVDDPQDVVAGGTGQGQGGRRGTGSDGDRENDPGGRAALAVAREEPRTKERARRLRFPRVLLSGRDEDPARAGTGESKILTERHPPLHQDDEDRRHNVWWINTMHPFAQAALKNGGSEGKAFRSYQLFMFRDVVQREALRMRQQRQAELDLSTIENELDDYSNRFLAELPEELLIA
jgi:hypothetical protein